MEQVQSLAEEGNRIEVVVTSTAEDAVRLAISNKFDAIVMDVNFGAGKMDGITAVRLMRSEGIRSRICVHTSNASQYSLDAALQAGADAFVPKPMTREALTSVIS